MLRHAVMVLAASLLAAGPNDDLDHLQGTWRIVRAEREGQPSPINDGKWIIHGDHLTIIEPIVIRGTFTLDPTKTPARFEQTASGAFLDDKVSKFKGIYQRDADKLTLYTVVLPNLEVPSKIPDPPEPGSILADWRRIDGPDGDGIDGTWRRIQFRGGGGIFRVDDVEPKKGVTMVIKNNNYVLHVNNEEHVVLQINTATDPKQLDYQYTEGPLNGQTTLGIYQLDGDRLTVCSRYSGKRPVEFSTKAGDLLKLQFFERSKEEIKAP